MPSTASKNFASHAKRLREKNGFSQRKLAKAMGLKGQFEVSDIENLRSSPSVKHLVMYSNFFGVAADSLLADTEQDKFGLMYPIRLNYRKQVRSNLERLAEEKGLSQEEVAIKLFVRASEGVSVEQLANMLYTRKTPITLDDCFQNKASGTFLSVDLLADFSAELGVSIERLLWSPERARVYSSDVVIPKIQLLQEELDLSQTQLTEQVSSLGLRINERFFGALKTGKNALSVTQFMALAVVLGTTVKTLLTPAWQGHSDLVTPFPPMWEAPNIAESMRGGFTSTEVFYDRRLGRNLRYYREQRGMSQQQLVEEWRNRGWSVSESKLSRIENGQYSSGSFTTVTVDFMMAVATVFAEAEGVTPVEFAEMLLTKRLWKQER